MTDYNHKGTIINKVTTAYRRNCGIPYIKNPILLKMVFHFSRLLLKITKGANKIVKSVKGAGSRIRNPYFEFQR